LAKKAAKEQEKSATKLKQKSKQEEPISLMQPTQEKIKETKEEKPNSKVFNELKDFVDIRNELSDQFLGQKGKEITVTHFAIDKDGNPVVIYKNKYNHYNYKQLKKLPTTEQKKVLKAVPKEFLDKYNLAGASAAKVKKVQKEEIKEPTKEQKLKVPEKEVVEKKTKKLTSKAIEEIPEPPKELKTKKVSKAEEKKLTP
ncbi:MAG: hypothetical protein ACP5K4_06795, partial [Caldisericum sp.]